MPAKSQTEFTGTNVFVRFAARASAAHSKPAHLFLLPRHVETSQLSTNYYLFISSVHFHMNLFIGTRTFCLFKVSLLLIRLITLHGLFCFFFCGVFCLQSPETMKHPYNIIFNLIILLCTFLLPHNNLITRSPF